MNDLAHATAGSINAGRITAGDLLAAGVQLGLDHAALAEAMGVEPHTVEKWSQKPGKVLGPSAQHHAAAVVARALGVSGVSAANGRGEPEGDVGARKLETVAAEVSASPQSHDDPAEAAYQAEAAAFRAAHGPAAMAGNPYAGMDPSALLAAAKALRANDHAGLRQLVTAAAALDPLAADPVLRAAAEATDIGLTMVRAAWREARKAAALTAGAGEESESGAGADALWAHVQSLGWTIAKDARTSEGVVTIASGMHIPVSRSALRDALYDAWEAARIGGRSVPPEEAINGVAAVIAAKGRRSAASTTATAIRYAPLPGADNEAPPAGLFIDLGNETRQAVMIRPGMVSIVGPDMVDATGVRFVLPSAAAACAPPQLTATPDEALTSLSGLVSLQDPIECRLLFGVLAASMLPLPATLPIIGLLGDPGSGKTAVAAGIKGVLDPGGEGVTAPPRDLENLKIRLAKTRAVALDNVGRLGAELADLLCIAATGGSAVKRRLYSDDDELILRLHTTVILTGVNEALIAAPDLLDRAVNFLVRRPKKHRSDRETAALWSKALPVLHGGLFNALSAAWAHIDWKGQSEHGRLAATVQMLAALDAAKVCGGGFVDAFVNRRASAAREVILQSPVLRKVVQVVMANPVPGGWCWRGSAAALFAAIGSSLGERDWPQSEAALGLRLKQALPTLAAAGVTLETSRTATRRETVLTVAASTGTSLRDAAKAADIPFVVASVPTAPGTTPPAPGSGPKPEDPA